MPLWLLLDIVYGTDSLGFRGCPKLSFEIIYMTWDIYGSLGRVQVCKGSKKSSASSSAQAVGFGLTLEIEYGKYRLWAVRVIRQDRFTGYDTKAKSGIFPVGTH